MGRPSVLILDEPTNELDPHNRRLVWDTIRQRNAEGATVVLVTHNVLEAERVIQRVAVMNSGRIVALGTPGELKARPLNIGLAWAYVGLRVAHSLIQCTVNFVPVRFVVFSLSTLVLMAITARTVLALLATA
jgi:energy-coupling factor transporter ATP-binding protein EcfA2